MIEITVDILKFEQSLHRDLVRGSHPGYLSEPEWLGLGTRDFKFTGTGASTIFRLQYYKPFFCLGICLGIWKMLLRFVSSAADATFC
jgi:hypothetical protein